MTHSKIASFVYNIPYGAFQTPCDCEVGVWLKKALKLAFVEDPIRIRMSGGSNPHLAFCDHAWRAGRHRPKQLIATATSTAPTKLVARQLHRKGEDVSVHSAAAVWDVKLDRLILRLNYVASDVPLKCPNCISLFRFDLDCL